MMKQRERLAVFVLILILVGLPVAALGYQYVLRPRLSLARVVDIAAAVPESGGFQPASVQVSAGETVTLRFSSTDVTHGVAIGPGLGVDLGHVDPGHVAEVILTFDQPGTYTFYCNTWCSPNHWRMRGVIEVRDPANPNVVATPQTDPVIAALAAEGVDIDARVHAAAAETSHLPESYPTPDYPSARRGEAVAEQLDIPAELQELAWRRSHTPAEGLDLLAEANPGAEVSDLWDVIVYLWTSDADPEQLAQAAELYARNCAACHGEDGGGDGFMASQTTEIPAAFSDPAYMFTMRSDVLYAKIRRGGMGTDMPNFGTLLTPGETWALVDYLWTFTMQE